MKLTNTEIALSIEVEDSLIEQIYRKGLQHYPKELGGLLIGYYTDDKKTVMIQETLLPKKYKSSKYGFKRETEGLIRKLEKYYAQQPSLKYVGEWHTHPDGLPIPSATDINAISEIVNCETVFINNPVFLIVGINSEKYDLGFYVYFHNKIYFYEEKEEGRPQN